MKNFIFLSIILLFFCACSPYSNQVRQEYDTSHYTQLYKTLHKATEKKSNDLLLWQMQSGFLTFSYFGPYFSIDDLEKAESLFKVYEANGLLSSIGSNIGATLSNDNAMPYKGYIYEGALLNFYKALAFSSIGDNVNARIEFNRANDRQRRAKDYYQKEIQKANKEIADEAAKNKVNSQYKVSDSDFNKIIENKYSNLKNFSIYKDLINPAIPYVSGIFFMIEKDYSKAIDLLKESYGISHAQIIANDMQILESRKAVASYPTFTWIIIEDGDIARKIGFDLSIPFVTPNGINSINIALPQLVNGRSRYQSYRVNNTNAEIVSQVSQLFASEFEKQLPTIITRAIVSAIVKFGITYSANQMGDYGAIAGLLTTLTFSAITTADTRTSIILPNSVWIARVPNTESDLKIFGNNTLLAHLAFTNKCDALSRQKNANLEFNSLIKAKNKDLSARINFFKTSNLNPELCQKTDNILYLRARGSMISKFIIKGNE